MALWVGNFQIMIILTIAFWGYYVDYLGFEILSFVLLYLAFFFFLMSYTLQMIMIDGGAATVKKQRFNKN